MYRNVPDLLGRLSTRVGALVSQALHGNLGLRCPAPGSIGLAYTSNSDERVVSKDIRAPVMRRRESHRRCAGDDCECTALDLDLDVVDGAASCSDDRGGCDEDVAVEERNKGERGGDTHRIRRDRA